MNYTRPVIIYAIEENISALLSSPRESFTYEGTSFFPSVARTKRHPLTRDIDDLIIDVRGEDDWQCFIRVAISTKDRNLFRQHTYLTFTNFSSSDPSEPVAVVEARAVAWANSL